MNQDNYLVECVPNISEGRNSSRIEAIIDHIKTADTRILNVDSGYDANRTVFTLIGDIESVILAVKKLYHICAAVIDMKGHKGEHPRLGAVDVCPLIPFNLENLIDLKSRVEELGKELSKEIQIPVFMYAQSSQGEAIKTLPEIRKGQYEALVNDPKKLIHEPDFGRKYLNKKFGGTVLGVRDFMIAYNVNLSTQNLSITKQIAAAMRRIRTTAGYYAERDIKPLQIMGWHMKKYNCCQISTNIHNPRTLSIVDVYHFTQEISEAFGVQVTSSELIGMMPYFAVELAQQSLREKGIKQSIVSKLGLDFNGTFSLTERTIPSRLEH